MPTQGSENLVKSGGIYNAIETSNFYTDSKISEVNNRITQLHTETVLFESSTVNYNDITLTDSVANYNTIEIFGETSQGHLVYHKMFNCNGKKFILCTTPVYSGSYAGNFNFVFKEYTISDNMITGNAGNSGNIEVTTNGKHNQTTNNNTVGITKIIGYK